MANLNRVLLMGNLTRDVEIRYTPSGMAVGKFGLAVNRKFRDSRSNELREEVTFVDIEAWGKQAEIAHQYLAKGRPVFIEGRLKLDQWDDKQTGQKRSKLFVVTERLQFVGQAPQGGPRPLPAAPQRTGADNAAGTGAAHESAGPEDLDVPDENIPF